MNPWICLVAGGFFEMCWALVMNLSDGFVKVEWGIAAYLISLISVYLLYVAMRKLPIGMCYAVWAGCGTVMSAVFGWIIFSQGLSMIEIFFLAILIGGILLLQLQEGSGDGEEAQRDQ